ncbi:hypothetical protein [Azospirillum sp.]|uniref:hypothetical protein n=1 Tax=Azospirillum sp. TaxID=34012 RepID=UPI003D73DEFD
MTSSKKYMVASAELNAKIIRLHEAGVEREIIASVLRISEHAVITRLTNIRMERERPSPPVTPSVSWYASMGEMVNHGTDEEPDWRCNVRLLDDVVTRVVRRRPLPLLPTAGVYGCASRMCSDLGSSRTSAW